MTKFVLVIAWISVFAWLLAGAVDQEFASAGEPVFASAITARGAITETGGLRKQAELYQNRPIRWWARRAVQARRDANARKQTILRLRRAQAKDAAHFFSWLRGAECIHHEEGAWTSNTGNGYYGGMQADRSFQRAYAPTYYRAWGTANNWPMWAQLHMAYNGWLARSWHPWPNTARECGLL